MKSKKINLLIFFIEIFIISILIVMFYKLITLQEKRTELVNEFKKMEDLSDILKQSSNDLTRFARSYVITKNKEFKNNYFTILDIRNGKIPQPNKYDKIYWNLTKEYREKEHHDYGKPISFKELITQLPFSKIEKEQLDLSEKKSNKLVKLEIEAFSILEKSNQEKAINLLFSDEYIKAKYEIMKPINMFLHYLDNRKEETFYEDELEVKELTFEIIAVISLFILFNIILYYYLRKIDKRHLKQKQKYKSLIEDIGERYVLFSHKIDGTMVYASSSAFNVFGLTQKEIMGYNYKDIVNWTRNSVKTTEEVFISLLNKEKQSIQYELSFLHISGEEKFLQVTSHLNIENGQLYINGIIEDITERRLQNKQLHRKQVESEIAQELSKVGSWTWDIKKNIFIGSEEAYKIYGINSPKTFDEITKFTHPADIDILINGVKNSLITGQINHVYRINKKGEIKWIHAIAKLIKDENTGEYIKAYGMSQDITESKINEINLDKLAHYDTLTNLPNRIKLLEHLNNVIELNSNEDKKIYLILINIDQFRRINDSYGHNTGNEIIKQVTLRLIKNFSNLGLIAKISGDEFAIEIEFKDDAIDMDSTIKNIIDTLTKSYNVNEHIKLYLNVSLGISYIDGAKNANELFQYADTALFKAKKFKGNSFEYYDSTSTVEIQENLALQNDLYDAFKDNQFELYYQPQVSINDGSIVGTEALIRWNHPKLGLVPPNKFIAIAEESELISHLGRWIIIEACSQGKKWQDKGINIHVSINVSLEQLRHQDLVLEIDNAISKTGFNPNNLVVELTESMMMDNLDELIEILNTLKLRGVKIAIDDFGTGYSSYSYLKNFPIDILKIDKIFVDNVPNNKDDVAIIKAIIAMSSALGFKVLAEGVETKEQLDFLEKNACEFYQGYYCSKPLQFKEVEKLLLNKK